MTTFDDYCQSLREKGVSYTVVDGAGAIVMPGLVLGHTHIYSTFARGWNVPYKPSSFQDILDQMWWKLDGALGKEEIYYSALMSGRDYLKNGITTLIDHHASGKMITGSLEVLKNAIVDELGLRGIFCFETSDRFDVDACIDENMMFFKKMADLESCKVAGMLGLHASFTLGDESLLKLSKTPSNMPLHVHVGESSEDVEWTKSHCNQTVIERFQRYGLLRENNLYVHGNHLEDKDFDLIKDTGGLMAFNPSSNMNNGVGLPPYDAVTKKKIPWIVGNDGLGSGIARDLQTMIFGVNLQGPGHCDLEQVHRSILNSYEYVSRLLGCDIGCLEAGYEADIMLIPYDSVTPMDAQNVFGHFIYGILEQMHPREVWVAGKQKVHNFKMTKKIEGQADAARKCAASLWQTIEDEKRDQ